MSDHSTYLRPFRFVFLFGAVLLLAGIFWMEPDILSAISFERGSYPAELASGFENSAALPQGQDENSSESIGVRNYYAQINDEVYSPIHQPQVSRLIALNPDQDKPAPALASEIGSKLQCSLKASAGLNNINGVAINSKECY